MKLAWTLVIVAGCGSQASTEPPPREEPATVRPPSNAQASEPPTSGDPGAMPFAVGPSGFVEVGAESGQRRYSSPPGSGCMVEVRWWRPRPTGHTGPMVVEHRRPTEVMGQPREVLRTSQFEGSPRVLDVVMLPEDDVHTRVVFRDCGEAEVESFLQGLHR